MRWLKEVRIFRLSRWLILSPQSLLVDKYSTSFTKEYVYIHKVKSPQVLMSQIQPCRKMYRILLAIVAVLGDDYWSWGCCSCGKGIIWDLICFWPRYITLTVLLRINLIYLSLAVKVIWERIQHFYRAVHHFHSCTISRSLGKGLNIFYNPGTLMNMIPPPGLES